MDLSYEDGIEQLEENLKKLEEGKISLEDHMEIFDQSIKLYKHCSELLSKTEKTVKLLLEDDYIVEEEFKREV